MNHSKIIVNLLLPANKQSTKAIHPAMCAFYYPMSSPIAWNSFLGAGFFTNRSNVPGVFLFRQQLMNIWIIIALVHAHILWTIIRHFWPLSHYGLQCRLCQLHVVAISSFYSNRQYIWQDQFPKYGGIHQLSATPESDHKLCLALPDYVVALSTDTLCAGDRIDANSGR